MKFSEIWAFSDGCGKTKSCYSEPESCTSSGDCEYLVTLKPVGDEDTESGEVEFELSCKGQWAAIGFNKEKNKMVRKCTGPILVVRRKLLYLPCGSSVRRLFH